MIEVGRDLWRLFGLLPPTQAGPATEDRILSVLLLTQGSSCLKLTPSVNYPTVKPS